VADTTNQRPQQRKSQRRGFVTKRRGLDTGSSGAGKPVSQTGQTERNETRYSVFKTNVGRGRSKVEGDFLISQKNQSPGPIVDPFVG